MATFKLSENWGSTLLGFIVVLILGGFLLNVFRGDTNQQEGEIGEGGDAIEQVEAGGTYIVQGGDTLWIIAENEYGSGYNWVSIAEANNLISADDIEEGQELVLPNVKPILVGAAAIAAANAVGDAMEEKRAEEEGDVAGDETEAMPTSSTDGNEEAIMEDDVMDKESMIASPADREHKSMEPVRTQETLPSDVTVQPGDTLWSIAWIVYGDPYRWPEIAQVNNLANPHLIEVGTVLIIQ